MTGFLRHCETTDMQVSRLMDPERGRPWDQLLKVGVDEVLSRCYRVIHEGTVESPGISVDDYRSAMCAQLRNSADDVQAQTKSRSRNAAPRRSLVTFSVADDEPPIRHVARGRRPRSQKDVSLPSSSRGSKGKETASAEPVSKKTAKKAGKRKLANVMMSESSEEY